MLYITASCVLGLLLLILHRRARTEREAILARSLDCQPPRDYPLTDKLFGCDFLYRSMRLIRQCQNISAPAIYHQEYSRTFRVKTLGQAVFYTIHPDNLEAVYETKSMDWGVEPHRLKAMQPFCGIGYITSDGKPWERSRAMLKPSLALSKVEDLTSFGIAVDEFLSLLPPSDVTVDLSQALDELFLDTGTHFTLGQRFHEMSSHDPMGIPDARSFLKAFHAAQFWANMRIFFGLLARVLSICVWPAHYQIVHRFIDHYVNVAMQREHRREPPLSGAKDDMETTHQRRSLISSLVEQTNDRNEIRWQVIQGLMAMQNTTSTLISNTLFSLSRNPSIWERLRANVKDLNADVMTATTLSQTTLLQNVLKESLRLYPVFGQSGRTALKDTVLPVGGGPNGSAPIFVAAGSVLMSNFYALHRQTAVFGDDLDSFNPDRWNHIAPKPYEYMPFGNGPRGCTGKHKALLEASYLIARMTLRFARIESRDDRDWAGDWKLIVKNLNGCKVALSLE